MKTAEKILSFIKSFLGHAGFYFTLVVMSFTVFLTVNPDTHKVADTKFYWWILLFSVLYSLCNFVLKIKFIESYIAKLSIHYVLIVLDFALVIAYGSGAASSPKGMVFVIIAFAFAYLFVEIIRGIFHSISHKKKNEETEYKTLFTSKN